MKTVFIPRDAHETYFMPAGKQRPKTREIAAYLSARHPLFGPDCRVDNRKCRIAGRDFYLLTVIDGPSRSVLAGRHGARFVTVPALLASSSLATSPCLIRCGGELVVFGTESESIPMDFSAGNVVPVDHDFATEADLLAFAAKEKIRVSLFPSRWRIHASILTSLLCLLLSAFMAVPQPEAVLVRKNLVTGTVPAVTGTSFQGLFLAVLAAAEKSGGIIEEYRFSVTDKAHTEVAFKNGNPEMLIAALRSIPSIEDIALRDVRYADTNWRYRAVFSANSTDTADPGTEEGQLSFAPVYELEKRCSLEGWDLSASTEDGRTVFSIIVPASSFHHFPEALFSHCSEKGLAVAAFQVGRKKDDAAFTVALELIEGRAENDAQLPEANTVKAAFGLNVHPRPETIRTSADVHSGRIGKITDSAKGIFVFGKSPSGKMTMEKETEK